VVKAAETFVVQHLRKDVPPPQTDDDLHAADIVNPLGHSEDDRPRHLMEPTPVCVRSHQLNRMLS